MSIFRQLLNAPERRGYTVEQFGRDMDSGLSGYLSTLSTQHVDAVRALGIPTFYCGARIISETVGSLPLGLFKEKTRGGLEEAKSEDLYWILKNFPNEINTSMEFFETETLSGVVRGNAFSRIKRTSRGYPLSMDFVHPDSVQVHYRRGHLFYEVSPDPRDEMAGTGTEILFPGDDMMHLRLTSQNGLLGMSTIAFFRETLGIALSEQEYAARMFANGARPSGIITLKDDANISDETIEDARIAWQTSTQGVKNFGKTAFLPGPFEFSQISLSAEDAQYMQGRLFTIGEIARMLRVPPHLLYELQRSTNNNIVQQSLEFVIHTIRPWLQRWEQVLTRDLLTEGMRRKGLFVKFNHDALLRGDPLMQAQVQSIYLRQGVLSINEVRDTMDRNPREGGDKLTTQMQNVDINANPAELQAQKPAEKPAKDKQKDPEKDEKPAKEEKSADTDASQVQTLIRAQTFGLLQDAVEKVLRKEANAVANAVEKKKSSEEFTAWMRSFYADQETFCRDVIMPVAKRVGPLLGQDLVAGVDEFSRTYAARAQSKVKELMTGDWRTQQIAIDGRMIDMVILESEQYTREIFQERTEADAAA